MISSRIATARAEIGIRYHGDRSTSPSLLPYFVKEMARGFLLFLQSPRRKAIGWLSRDAASFERICGTEREYLDRVTAIDGDDVKGLCVLTEHPQRLYLLDLQGRVREEIPLSLPGKLISIHWVEEGILIGTWQPGGLYLVDQRGDSRWEFCPGSRTLLEARSVCSAGDGSFYVADAGLHRIIQVRRDGRVECRYGMTGVPGRGASTLYHPSMVDLCHDGTLLVCDTRNHRILKIAANGSVIWQWPQRTGEGERTAQLWIPKCSRELADGGLVIADTFNFRVLLLDRHHNVLRSFGSTPVDERSLCFPRSVQLLRGQRFLIADTYNDRVVEIDRHSRVLWRFGGGSGDAGAGSLWWPRRALRLRDGRTVIADGRNDRIVLLDSKGRLEKCLDTIPVAEGPVSLKDPHDIEQTSEGNLIVTDTGNDRILEVTPEGSCRWAFPDERARREGWSLADPHHAILDRRQRLLIADTGNNRILVVDRRSRTIREVRHLRKRSGEELALCQPRAARFFSGRLWILDSGNSRIFSVTEDGTVIWHWDGTLLESPIEQVYMPRWMTVLGPDQVLVTDYFHSRVLWLRLRESQELR